MAENAARVENHRSFLYLIWVMRVWAGCVALVTLTVPQSILQASTGVRRHSKAAMAREVWCPPGDDVTGKSSTRGSGVLS